MTTNSNPRSRLVETFDRHFSETLAANDDGDDQDELFTNRLLTAGIDPCRFIVARPRTKRLLGSDADWIEDHASCDVIEVSNLDHDTAERIGVVTGEGPFDPAKVGLVDALATAVGGTVTFYFPIGADAPESRRNTTDDYLSELVALCEAPVETRIVESSPDDAIELAARSDVLVVSGFQRGLTDRLFGRVDPITAGTEHGTLVVYGATQPGRLRQAVERHLF